MRAVTLLPVLLTLAAALQGCVAAVVGGAAAGGAIVAHDRRTFGRFVDDQSLELKAGKLIGDDRALDGKVRINVTSMNSIVLLTGQAQTAELRDRVLAHVRSLAGIRRIHNHVQIADPAQFASVSRDKWLYTKLKSKQATKKGVNPTRVKVVTSSSVVYLMGLVTREEASAATDIARQTGGVSRVVMLFEYID